MIHMIAIKTIDIRNDFKKVSNLINSGETVLISRPKNENLVIISEKEYNELEKARRNVEYMNMIENSVNEIETGKTISFTMEEIEAIECMVAEDAKAYITNYNRGRNT